MPIVTNEILRGDKGWVPTPRLRWLNATLQQLWDNPASGKHEWRTVPTVSPPQVTSSTE